jgi:anti-anti-sigma factor
MIGIRYDGTVHSSAPTSLGACDVASHTIEVPDEDTPTRDRLLSAVEVDLRAASAPGYAAVVSLVGEHDAATSDEIGEALAAFDGDVLVDLSDCTFIDSTVIRVLLTRSENLRSDGHQLELVAPPANVTITRVLSIVHADTILVVHPERPAV